MRAETGLQLPPMFRKMERKTAICRVRQKQDKNKVNESEGEGVMKRKTAGLLLSMALAIGCFPVAAMANEESKPVGGFAFAEPEKISEEEAEKIDAAFAEEEGLDAQEAVTSFAKKSLDPVFVNSVGTYGKNSLSSAQKAFYEEIDAAATKFMIGGDSIFNEVDYYASGAINFADNGLSYEQAAEAFVAYDYDHPAYYWMQNYRYTDKNMFLITFEEYMEPAQREAINKQIISGVKRIANIAGAGKNDFEKALLVESELTEAADYAYEIDGETPVKAKWAHSPVGIFDESYAGVVCEGYADTFALMMNYMKIPNVYVVGKAGTGRDADGHAWNLVSFDGGKSYSYIDVTWDDCGYDEDHIQMMPTFYKYFGMPKTEFEKDHTTNTPDMKEGYWMYKLPANITDDLEHTYFYQAGSFLTDETADVEDFIDDVVISMPVGTRFFAIMTDRESLRDSVYNELHSKLPISMAFNPFEMKGKIYYIVSNSLWEGRYEKPISSLKLAKDEVVVTNKEDSIEINIEEWNPVDTNAYLFVRSSDPRVLTIDNPHISMDDMEPVKATIHERGQAEIIVSSFDEGDLVSCNVVVEKGLDATSITLDQTSLIMGLGGKRAKVKASVAPAPASQLVIWETSNSKVATVDEYGIVTPVSAGSCTITATSKDTPSVKATCKVQVLANCAQLTIYCTKDGEDWDDGTQPVFTLQPVGGTEQYPSGGYVPSGTVDVLANGVLIGKKVLVPNDPQGGYNYTLKYFTISFVNDDNTPLETQFVLEGRMPAYSKGTPVKERVGDTVYRFVGWDPALTIVKAKVTYKAMFTAGPRDADEVRNDPETQRILKEQGYLLSKDKKTVSYAGPADRSIKSLKIPANATVSGVNFPVTKIESNALSGCGKLAKVTIGKNVKAIGKGAFKGCKSLKSITIPSKVKKIGAKAFFGCKKLGKITFKTTKLKSKTVGSKAFGNTKKNLTMKVPGKSKNSYGSFMKKKGNKSAKIK